MEGSKVRANRGVLFTPMSDGTGILLDLETKFYFTLSETAAFCWQQLEREADGAPLTAVAKSLAERYEVDEPSALGDLQRLCRELGDHGLVQELS